MVFSLRQEKEKSFYINDPGAKDVHGAYISNSVGTFDFCCLDHLLCLLSSQIKFKLPEIFSRLNLNEALPKKLTVGEGATKPHHRMG